ncbi:NACHT domain-containing protein [Paractinoplanes rishiriensis]|uniref:AAA+ ATPase domain-containing protein n=1 Tax=Paractinoplanes rishiriensis TaxID=1050105 RepID=A0A919KA06_9ACTN|nr:ATP-binding protein [Actinoplanes rishiriensis]GIE99371.1 hypothetical protein Ari01nite_68360 [Actinoplanes rishiriensis]
MKKTKDVEANFETVRSIVRSAQCDSTIVTAVDRLTSAALILSPLVLGPASVPLLALFDMKSDLIRHAHDAVRAIAGYRGDFLARSRSLAAAHAMITYSAFFEAMDRDLRPVLKKLKPTAKDRRLVVERSAEAAHYLRSVEDVGGRSIAYNAIAPVSLPHPSASFATEADDRHALYLRMTDTLSRVLEHLGGAETVVEIRPKLHHLPRTAVEVYFAQYLELMLEFQDFFGWATLYEAQKTQQMIGDLTEDARLAQLAVAGIDIGLESLRQAVTHLSSALPAPPRAGARAVIEDLAVIYRLGISERIITDTYDDPGDAPVIRYPTKAEAFVPQAYQTLEYTNQKIDLENEATWSELPAKDDLGVFLARYFDSPYSAWSALLVLGHPGSGKSLLTELIAARLMPPAYNVVRIELRDIEPDSDIQSQIEDQIRADTGHEINWVEFATELAGDPPLIILDGYDELLQATGRVFANYLDKVHRFQRREAMLQRPVRIMVTSRITLIDKAVIPASTAVVRLLEFDEDRRQAWTDVWNRTNAGYFDRTPVEPFTVPADARLLDLARQPLLLLMLAIYDSRDNELRQSRVDQTLLYHSLLHRFIARERGKGEAGAAFRALDQAGQDQMVEDDLNRLGVAAIGMFNRNALHIHRRDLDADIAYFGAEREVVVPAGAALTQADLLLGSFFFIHESRSRSGDRDDRSGGHSAAFEFLHNTFGEFLTADFVVRQVLRQTTVIRALRQSDALRQQLDVQLAQADDRWFAPLAFTSLHTRPVILSMIREWLPHRAELAGLAQADLVGCLHLIVTRQLRDTLTGTPAGWLSDGIAETKFERFAYLGHLAVYTFNLATLAAVAGEDGYTFDVPVEAGRPAGSEPAWDGLRNLWRSWFSLDGLAGAAALIEAKPGTDGVMVVRAKRDFGMPPGSLPLDLAHHLNTALGDEMGRALTGLAGADLMGWQPADLTALGEPLERLGAGRNEFLLPRTSRLMPGSHLVRDGWAAMMIRRRSFGAHLPLGAMSAHELLRAERRSDAAFDVISDLRPDLDVLIHLSDHEAGVVIENHALLQPQWLHDVIRAIANGDLSYPKHGGPDPDHFIAPIFYHLRRLQVTVEVSTIMTGLLRGGIVDRLGCRSLVEVLLFLRHRGLPRDQWSVIDVRLARRLSRWTDLRRVPEDSMVDLIHLVAAERPAMATRRHLVISASGALARRTTDHHQVSFTQFLAGFSLPEVRSVSRSSNFDYHQLFHRRSRLLAWIRSAVIRGDARYAARVLKEALSRAGRNAGALDASLRQLLDLDNEELADRRYTVGQRQDIDWLLRKLGRK